MLNSYIRMLKNTAISQEILTISAAPAGNQEENNTLTYVTKILKNMDRVLNDFRRGKSMVLSPFWVTLLGSALPLHTAMLYT